MTPGSQKRLLRLPASFARKPELLSQTVTFGQRVRELRESKRMTQDELASGAGVQRPDVSKIENGRSEPNLRTIRKIARKLEVSLSELFKGVE